jgi:hypothetical protein
MLRLQRRKEGEQRERCTVRLHKNELKGTVMNLGFSIGAALERERHEAYSRAMARFRSNQGVREKARRPGLGRGTRILSREEAVAKIAKTHPRSALKLLAGYGIGRPKPVPERRGR